MRRNDKAAREFSPVGILALVAWPSSLALVLDHIGKRRKRSVQRLTRRPIRRETGREKWGGSLAVQPRWQRRTNVWRKVTNLRTGPMRLRGGPDGH
jgi:hypothetical protein